MKYAYTAILEPYEDGAYTVSFPDLPGCVTEGKSIEDAIYMAQDVLCLWLYDKEIEKEPIPEPTAFQNIQIPHGALASIVVVDTDDYHRYFENKAVKKTLTIPSWLNQKAEAANINFSQTLQNALKEQLNIDRP